MGNPSFTITDRESQRINQRFSDAMKRKNNLLMKRKFGLCFCTLQPSALLVVNAWGRKNSKKGEDTIGVVIVLN